MEPFVPRILLVANSLPGQAACARLQREFAASGLPLMHCLTAVEAAELCESVHFDCVVTEEPLGGAGRWARDDQGPAVLLIDAEAPARDAEEQGAVASGLVARDWASVAGEGLLDAVRAEVERRRVRQSERGWLVSHPPLRSGAGDRSLRQAVGQMRQGLLRVEALLDGLRRLSALDPEEAVVELGLFLQEHEDTLVPVWEGLRQCEVIATSSDEEALAGPPPSQLHDTWIESEAARNLPPPSGVRQRIVVVDDEPAVLRAFRRVLQPHYEVLTARDGAEALALVLGDKQVHAVLCDLGMPKLDGPSFFGELSELRPQLMPRVIFCTGGAASERTRRFMEGLPNPVLRKPVDARDLMRTIERVGR